MSRFLRKRTPAPAALLLSSTYIIMYRVSNQSVYLSTFYIFLAFSPPFSRAECKGPDIKAAWSNCSKKGAQQCGFDPFSPLPRAPLPKTPSHPALMTFIKRILSWMILEHSNQTISPVHAETPRHKSSANSHTQHSIHKTTLNVPTLPSRLSFHVPWYT